MLICGNDAKNANRFVSNINVFRNKKFVFHCYQTMEMYVNNRPRLSIMRLSSKSHSDVDLKQISS